MSRQCQKGLGSDDLFQVGCMALHKAVRKHNFKQQFVAFAKKTIERDIMQYLDKHNRTIRLPEHIIDKVFVRKTTDNIDPYLHRQVTQPTLSIHHPLDDDNKSCLADTLVYAPDDNNSWKRETILRALKHIRSRHADVLRMRYFESRSLESVAQVYGISKQRIRQIEGQAVKCLKSNKIAKRILSLACKSKKHQWQYFWDEWENKSE